MLAATCTRALGRTRQGKLTPGVRVTNSPPTHVLACSLVILMIGANDDDAITPAVQRAITAGLHDQAQSSSAWIITSGLDA